MGKFKVRNQTKRYKNAIKLNQKTALKKTSGSNLGENGYLLNMFVDELTKHHSMST